MASREKRRLKLISQQPSCFLPKGAGVSIQDVAEAANVSRATLCTYFSSKDEIFDAAVDGIILSVSDRAKNTLLELPKVLRYKKAVLMFEAQQKSWFEVSGASVDFYFEIWTRSQSMAKREMMPFTR